MCFILWYTLKQCCVLWFFARIWGSFWCLTLLCNTLFQESLGYRLTGSKGDIGSWGHEYVRNLAGEIAEEYTVRQDRKQLFMSSLCLAFLCRFVNECYNNECYLKLHLFEKMNQWKNSMQSFFGAKHRSFDELSRMSLTYLDITDCYMLDRMPKRLCRGASVVQC